MSTSRWSDDAFLDPLRQQGDELADETVERLRAEHGIAAVNRIFQILRGDHQPLPDDAPAPFREFMAATAAMPDGLDVARLDRGAAAFREHASSAALVLLAASLPAGYSAPCLSRILTVSDNLGTHPYKRLMGVLQLVVNVSSTESAEDCGRAHLTARKLRLLHAGIRHIVPRHRPGYRERFGVPVNHEDMLATIMGFSYLVVDGLHRLKLDLTDAEAEDFYYLWRVFAQMMGIHPPGKPESAAYVPATLAEAAEFYRSYERRNYAAADENPDGVALAEANLRMIRDLIPRPLRLMGLERAPRIAMQELLGARGMVRVGIKPVEGHPVERMAVERLVGLAQATTGEISKHFLSRLSDLVFQRMIDRSRGGKVRFLIPPDLDTVRREL